MTRDVRKPLGGARPGAGRRSAFPQGVQLVKRELRLPQDVWNWLDARAEEGGTTVPGAIAILTGHDPRGAPRVPCCDNERLR